MDKTDPLLNRAISGYAPGSTFKILTALSGFLAPGKMAHGYTCNNYVEYGNRAFPCWTVQKSMGGHGWLDLTGGIQRSCNCFFYQYGNDAGIENIGKMTRMIGLGTSTGVELEGENPGLIPGPAWLKASSGERWSSARTANVSIGQGEVLASPLQMCMVASTVANGQFSYVPTLVHHREDRSTGTKTKFLPKVRQDLLKEGVKRQQMELLRSGMRKVVNEPGGTGSNFRSQIPDIAEHGGGAGKTGTAQFKRAGKKDNHTWFICFAPYENPKVACCIFVQGGNSGGGCAAPVARRVVEQTLSLESGAYRVDPKAIGRMGEAKGHFNFIEAVKYPGENVPDAPVDDVDTDDSNAREVDDAPIKVKAVPAEPTFKSETQKEAPKARPVERPKYQTNTPP
jgi:penicillin-binding protein 2